MKISLRQQWQDLQDKTLQAWQQYVSPHYLALAPSEQRIIRITAILLPLTILVFAILLPAADNNTALKQEIASLSKQVLEARQLAKQLSDSPQPNNSKSQSSILTQVDQLARQTKVRTFMIKLRPQQVMGGKQRVQTQIRNAPYPKVVTFLVALEKYGLSIVQLNIQTAKDGLVNMQAVVGH